MAYDEDEKSTEEKIWKYVNCGECGKHFKSWDKNMFECGDCIIKRCKNKATIEDAMEFAEESKTYREVLTHRRKCEKWGKSFCLECFGGGLTTFTKNLNEEKVK
jgi:hypothetical protein